MKLKGHIKTIKSSEDRMGDIVHTLSLEVVGDIKALQDFTEKPLDITIEIEG